MIRRYFVLLTVVLLFSSCFASIKPIYYDTEQAKAERAVAQFHRLHNESKFEDIYSLLDETTHTALTKEEFLAAAKGTAEKWGKVQNATLSQAKVFPSTPIQVKMIYNVKWEKGDGQEWFTWNIHGEDARLLQYQTAPGFDTPDSEK